MASYYVAHPGNTAIQTEVWNLTQQEAKAALALLKPSKGSYWHMNLEKAYRRAVRARADTLRVYTAGFSSGELSNILFNCDIPVSQRDQY